MPGAVLPSLRRTPPRVSVVVDTSGSVSDTELGSALLEVTAISRAVGGRRDLVSVVPCDAASHEVHRLCRAEGVPLVGGGGTDLRAGFARALAARPRPDVLVVLTDGRTRWPASRPPAGRWSACSPAPAGPPTRTVRVRAGHPARVGACGHGRGPARMSGPVSHSPDRSTRGRLIGPPRSRRSADRQEAGCRSTATARGPRVRVPVGVGGAEQHLAAEARHRDGAVGAVHQEHEPAPGPRRTTGSTDPRATAGSSLSTPAGSSSRGSSAVSPSTPSRVET